jgi:hypothetical protein
MKIRPSVWLAVAGVLCFGTTLGAADFTPMVTLTPLGDRVRIEIGGKPFSEFIFSGAPRPYFYPILAADGTALTHDRPADHLHHHSLWFGHGAVNGQDFWREIAGTGRIVPEDPPEITSGAVGTLRLRDRWVAADGKVVCTDDVTVRIQPVPGGRMLDYEITLHALKDAPLVFGDSKEGTMALRVAPWMTVAGPGGGKNAPTGSGHIVMSTGLRDNATWGKPAEWCDFYGSHEGRVHGIAIFDHPKNPRHPTPWMVRGYGLFAADPFGAHDFNPQVPAGTGDFTIPAGGSATFRYRFYFHEGDTDAAQVLARYREYAAAH